MRGSARIERLSAEQCLEHLGGTSIGHVALTISALPAIRSVRFALTPGGIVFRVAPDSQLRKAASNQVVAFRATSEDPLGRRAWGVNVQGVCTEVSDPTETEALGTLNLPAWHGPTSSDAFMRLPIDLLSGEVIYWP